MPCRNIPLPFRAYLAPARHRLFRASPVLFCIIPKKNRPLSGSLASPCRRLRPWPPSACVRRPPLTSPPQAPLFSTACVDLQSDS
ncbi:hypothetical protein BDP55DRAFT_168009 [Colletotrichum godetiae]|uniref:Uncharacterized protein n=1 Tax=Colletotrichum godetiae TaxID=1209918 RepID=A0AAJ0ANR9_9PEZI|nr:uncharacterized protein BDP55DRAFT_168009 [Colletotrichum godetiae]KAK1675076.1 hypothetical protein BDP55DRAFT_168009 [Colletotrichum godetiae]